MDDSSFSLKKIAVPAFGPSLLFGLGNGAFLPVVALSARDAGASPAIAGLIVALIGFGSLAANIPAALITSRIGERRALLGASAITVLALLMFIVSMQPVVLSVAALLIGVATAVFYLARQTYLIEVVPFGMRARALSMLGGVNRIGMFIGPFAGAGLMHFMGLAGAYWFGIVALLAAGVVSYYMPELRVDDKRAQGVAVPPRVGQVARAHARVFLTLGLGILLISAMRAARQIVIPLWGDHIGLGPAATSVIFGLSSAVDMLVFYPAGKIMDQCGRLWVALPCTLIMGLSLVLMPLSTGTISFMMIAMLLGIGNGFGSGINMTLGADASPEHGRTEFLGLWRLISDVGTCAGPFVLSGVTALLSLGAGIAVTGAFGFVAAALFWHWLPHTRLRR
ncbi:MFS transporter [Pusillimonas sp. TS35]|uniref:MFS transporter n=1 Tax=Paracandidimonas lactea TaxID=2895524 RepID=UPI001367C653|nr:MFS transporter [Paracandidimonas lactea]MYN12441.1 MFS transporter [Pusillimonas sp. TS35]